MNETAAPLADPRALERLEAAFDDYWAAPFGRLNVTADALRLAAFNAGYQRGGSIGPVEWARAQVKALRAPGEAADMENSQ